MNAGPADIHSPHLDLGDLIAPGAGQAADDRAREHLTRCEHCRAEAHRWDLVAGAVRGLMAATPEAAQPARPGQARPRQARWRQARWRPGRLRPGWPRVLAGPRRRTGLVVVAAALVLGAGYGAAAALTGNAPGALLAAVSGCPGLEQAAGTLQQVDGSSLVIKTASGQLVTVTTTEPTFVGISGALLGDVTDGESVAVLGPRSGGTIEAVMVSVGPLPSGGPTAAPPGPNVVQGTVTDMTAVGFTVVTSGGARVPVATSHVTVVTVRNATLSELRDGATTFAVGRAGPGRTLSAKAVWQLLKLPSGGQFHVSAHGCSPSSIASALAPGLFSGG